MFFHLLRCDEIGIYFREQSVPQKGSSEKKTPKCYDSGVSARCEDRTFTILSICLPAEFWDLQWKCKRTRNGSYIKGQKQTAEVVFFIIIIIIINFLLSP